MSQSKLKKEIDQLFKKEYYLSDVISFIIDNSNELDELDLRLIETKFIKSYLVEIKLYQDSAKINYINESINEFEREFDIVAKGIKSNKYSKAFRLNVISLFENELEKLTSKTDLKQNTNSRKIQIKQDTSLLIALFLELEKNGVLVFSNDRLGRLFEENFINHKGESISKGTIKTMCSKGISEMQYDDLKGILKQIVKK